MKSALIFPAVLSVFVILITGCKKTQDNPCIGKAKPSWSFVTKELIGDTAFITDTIFRDNYVQFQAVGDYQSVLWKIGSDPRSWTDTEFTLSFNSVLGTLPVKFTGIKTTDKLCFPNDTANYTATKKITIVEQVKKPFVTLSPLIGKYKGYFTDSPLHVFTIRIEYFDSTKYNTENTGSKNFYWLSNMPDNYISTLGWPYPELKNGQPMEMGYKCFVFGSSSNIVHGIGWLSIDTVFINYGNDFVGRRKFIGKKL